MNRRVAMGKIFEVEIRSKGAGYSMKEPHSHDYYELFFLYDGEERTLEVGRDEYYLYAIGDRFDIEICRGAFDDAFIKKK